MSEQEQVEYRIFTGPWVSTAEFVDRWEQAEAKGRTVNLHELFAQMQQEQLGREEVE